MLEVVDEDGEPVSPGEPGSRVLLTNLVNRAQPLIRYELSDAVVLEDGPDPSGRPYLRVARVDGRSNDFLRFPAQGGGEVAVHPYRLRAPFSAMLEVRQYQIVRVPDGLLVRVVARASAPSDLSDRVRSAIARGLGEAGAAPTTVRRRGRRRARAGGRARGEAEAGDLGGLGRERALKGRQEAGREADVADPGRAGASASASTAAHGVCADVLEQPRHDLAVAPLRPAADDAAVPPDGRAGVAVRVEQGRPRAGRGTSRAPSSPSSSGRASAAAPRTARAAASARGRRRARSRSRRRDRPRCVAPRRAQRASRAASSRSTSACPPRWPARRPRASGAASSDLGLRLVDLLDRPAQPALGGRPSGTAG